jgi:hypothetical protein
LGEKIVLTLIVGEYLSPNTYETLQSIAVICDVLLRFLIKQSLQLQNMSFLDSTPNEAVHVEVRRLTTSCHPQTQLQVQMPELKQLKSPHAYTNLSLLAFIYPYFIECAVLLVPKTTICPV